MDKLIIPYPIIVEGKYDRLKILCVAQARVLTTDGFGIFKKSEKLALLRALAQKAPIIVLTDSDGAGKVIRAHITSAIPPERLIQLYIPRIEGKEQRKSAPSAEGTIGVEGMEKELIYDLLLPYAESDNSMRTSEIENPLSKLDFYTDGLCGGENSAQKRDNICRKFNLPPGMSSNALLATLRVICTYDEYLAAVGREISDGHR